MADEGYRSKPSNPHDLDSVTEWFYQNEPSKEEIRDALDELVAHNQEKAFKYGKDVGYREGRQYPN